MKSSIDPEEGSSSGGCASSVGAATQPPPGASAGGTERAPAHYWEEEVFQGHKPSEECRAGLSYHGLLGRPPLLLAGVRGLDHEGKPFHWVARRQRKRVLHPHQVARPPPRVDWLGALDWRRHRRKLGWWIATLYSLGSILFCVSGVAFEVTAIGNVDGLPGLRSVPAALIGWTNSIAANLCFFPAGLIQMVEAANMDWDGRQRAWAASGRHLPRPRRRLLPTRHDLRTVSWWAALVQLSGMLGFNIATVSSLLAYTVAMQATAKTWLIAFCFTYGGAAFTASAVLFAWEATGSWWRGLVPSRCSDLRSISWQTAFWNVHGSVGFLIGGAAGYATHFSWTQMQWIAGYGNLGGAVWFLLSALAALLEQANPGHP